MVLTLSLFLNEINDQIIFQKVKLLRFVKRHYNRNVTNNDIIHNKSYHIQNKYVIILLICFIFL